jgi:hypothetical protein
MPRYFFHHHIGDRILWDGIGVELPDIRVASDADRAEDVWTTIVAGRLQPGRITVITDESGHLVFVTST